MSLNTDGGDPLLSVAQVAECSAVCAAKVWWKHFAIVHGSGAWSLIKLCYLIAKARGSRSRDDEFQDGWAWARAWRLWGGWKGIGLLPDDGEDHGAAVGDLRHRRAG